MRQSAGLALVCDAALPRARIWRRAPPREGCPRALSPRSHARRVVRRASLICTCSFQLRQSDEDMREDMRAWAMAVGKLVRAMRALHVKLDLEDTRRSV